MKKIFFSIIYMFVFVIPSYCTTINEIDTKIDILKKEIEYIQGILAKVEFLNERIVKDIEVSKKDKVIIDLNTDLGLEKEDSVAFYLALYKDVSNKYLITINKYLWGGKPLYLLNDIVVSIPEVVSSYNFKKRFNDICDIPWFKLSIDDKERNVLAFEVSSDIQLVVSLTDKYTDRLVGIEMELDRLYKLKSEIINKQDDLVEKWQLKFKGPAPIEFIGDIEEEMRRIEATPYAAARFPWYLQLLKTIKKSGYKMPSTDIENNILEKIRPSLKGAVTMDNLYEVLLEDDGIKKILQGEDKEKTTSNDKIFEFLSRLKKYLINKKEGEVDVFTNYYIKHNSYEELYEFLKSSFAKYNNFLDIEFDGKKDNLVEELGFLRDSFGRLTKRADFSEGRKLEYQNVYILIREMLKQQEGEVEQNVSVVSKFEESNWKDLVLEYMIFGNLLFVFLDYEYLYLSPVTLKISTFESDEFLSACMDSFFAKFNTDFFKYIGWGSYRADIFVKPWKILIKNFSYEENLKYPVLIKNDDEGKSLVLFKDSMVRGLRKDYLEDDATSAKLWLELFVGMAAFRSLGMHDDQISILMLLYIVDNFSSEEMESFVEYTKKSVLNNYIDKEDVDFSRLEVLREKGAVSDDYSFNKTSAKKNIEDIIVYIVNTYSKYKDSIRYKIRKDFENFDEVIVYGQS